MTCLHPVMNELPLCTRATHWFPNCSWYLTSCSTLKNVLPFKRIFWSEPHLPQNGGKLSFAMLGQERKSSSAFSLLCFVQVKGPLLEELQQKVEETEMLKMELQMLETERVRLSLVEEKLLDVLKLLQKLRDLVWWESSPGAENWGLQSFPNWEYIHPLYEIENPLQQDRIVHVCALGTAWWLQKVFRPLWLAF